MTSSSSSDVLSIFYRLVKCVMDTFYVPEVSFVMLLIVRNVIVSEDEIIALMRFDRKQLRQCIHVLSGDRLIKNKLKITTDEDGKTSRQLFYFINYKEFVNAIKYKLDFSRRKIEQAEKNCITYGTFNYQCSRCAKKFTDLDLKFIVDIENLEELRCDICGREVIELVQETATRSSSDILVRFNATSDRIFTLLRGIENVRLDDEHFDPEIPQKPSIGGGSHIYDSTFSKGKWSDKKKNIFGFLIEEGITVNIEQTSDKQKLKPARKEQPEWMKTSTVLGAINFETSNDTHPVMGESAPDHHVNSPVINSEEILDTLMANERSNERRWFEIRHRFGFGPRVHIKQYSSGKRPIDWDECDFSSISPLDKILVDGEEVRLCDIDDDCLRRMTSQEKEQYFIRGTQIHQHYFDI